MVPPRKRVEELSRVLRQKQQFLIDTLHEIRTPLEGIGGLVELVRRGGRLTAEQQKRLDMILSSSGQLRRLVGDLLQIERLETGEILYEFVHFDLGHLIAEVVPIGEALLAGNPEVDLECAIAPDLPAVHGDVRKIRQVLLNFLGNAVQFTRRGRIRITARPAGDHVRVDVSDTGVGIAEDEREIVWDQFHRAGGAISPAYEGVGLGLSINKKIVEEHRGTIGLTSEIGKGSSFFFTLPTCESGLLPAMKRIGPGGKKLAEEVTWEPRRPGDHGLTLLDAFDDAEGVRTPEKPAPLKREARYRKAALGHGERILVVDDSPVAVEILRDLLESSQYRVESAHDGAAALALVAREPPDLILTELWLPEMSGFDLVKRIREGDESRLVPIILLTARRHREDIAYGLNLGADDYVQKPFDRSELLARIGVLLRLRRAREELRALNENLEEEVRRRTEELSAAYERLHLSEKLSSLGQLTAGIAHELNNPLAYVLSNVELVRDRISTREVLRRIRRIRALLKAAAGEGTRVTLEETFLSALEEIAIYRQDVADYRADVENLGPDIRRERFLEFLTWLEGAAAARGGADRDLFSAAIRLLDSAEDGLHRVRRIVRDLSAFSHPGSEEPGPVDLGESVERVLTILTPALKEKDVRIVIGLKLSLPVRGVGGRIDQVVMNLVLNAVQASPRGGTVRIRTKKEKDRGLLLVEDEGPGIPPEVRSRIFDPFYTTKPVGEGTGLGLSICYRIVEGLSGEIGVTSRKGRGTVFTVRLPLRAGAKEAER